MERDIEPDELDRVITGSVPSDDPELAVLADGVAGLRDQLDARTVPMSNELSAALADAAPLAPSSAPATVIELAPVQAARPPRRRLAVAASIAAAFALLGFGAVLVAGSDSDAESPLAQAAALVQDAGEPGTIEGPAPSNELPAPAEDAEGDDGWSVDVAVPSGGLLDDELEALLDEVAPWFDCVSASVRVGADQVNEPAPQQECGPAPELFDGIVFGEGPCEYTATEDGAVIRCQVDGEFEGEPFDGEVSLGIDSWFAAALLADPDVADWESLTGDFEAAWPEIQAWLDEHWPEIEAELDAAWPEIQAEIDRWLPEFESQFDEWLPEFEGELEEWLPQFEGELEEWLPEFEAQFEDLVPEIEAQLDELAPELEAWLDELPPDVADQLDDLESELEGLFESLGGD